MRAKRDGCEVGPHVVLGSGVSATVGSALGAYDGKAVGEGVGEGVVGAYDGKAVGEGVGEGVGAPLGTFVGAGEGENVSTEMLSALAPAMPPPASSRRSALAVAPPSSALSPRIGAFAASARYERRRADASATIDAVKLPLETCACDRTTCDKTNKKRQRAAFESRATPRPNGGTPADTKGGGGGREPRDAPAPASRR